MAQSCPTLCDPMDYSLPGSSCTWDFPDKYTGVGCQTLRQIIINEEKKKSSSIMHDANILYFDISRITKELTERIIYKYF